MIPDSMYSLTMLSAIISPLLFLFRALRHRLHRVNDEREKEGERQTVCVRGDGGVGVGGIWEDWGRKGKSERETETKKERTIGTLKTKGRQLNNFVPLLAP